MKTLEINSLENISGGDISDIATGACVAVSGAGIGLRLGLFVLGGPVSSGIFTALTIGCVGYLAYRAYE
ncbi:hypothetical protein LB450_11950 [Psychroflexus sp. CAK1W]|uniref:hypothetical protein n=1 Tax=Psychroflexus curvus TaxID=2873595 RepID=UPI001CCE421F|nr:hypothetical protein [Psychroflexus curvus]MBZ9628817.1 hypothetical protein [Psychroflexus curvus]